MRLLWFSAFRRASPCPLLKEGVRRGRVPCHVHGRVADPPLPSGPPLSFGHFPRERGKPDFVRGIAAVLGIALR